MPTDPIRATPRAERPAPDPVSVSIAVVTFRRNESLAGLLPHLVRQARQAEADGTPTCVLVVDNDPLLGARETVEKAAAEAGDVRVVYTNETTPGIGAVRRRALAAADTDVLVFMDDDQIPDENWLAELLRTRAATRAAAVAGPVLPVYESRLPEWIDQGPFHSSPDFTDGALLSHAATGNLMLDLRQLRAFGVQMPDLGMQGGEDVMFTDRLTRAGGEIVWCRRAVARESIPASRTEPTWVLTRSMVDGANDSARRLDPEQSRTIGNRLRLTAGGALRVGAGAVRAVLGRTRNSPAHVGGGLHTMMRGAGMGLGAWDFAWNGYSRDGKPRWTRRRAD